MRRLALRACVALVAAPALAACGAAPDDPDEQPPVSQAAPSAASRSYPPQSLAAALPRGARQLHGFTVAERCSDITRPCVDGADPGTASVFATTRSAQDSILISVNDEWTKRFWRAVVSDLCPRGRVDLPIEPLDGGHFSPGERGHARRTSTSIGTWRGLRCERSVTLVFPSGYPSAWDGDESKGEEHTLLLTNGFHYLQVQSSRRELTHELAEEYLGRLG